MEIRREPPDRIRIRTVDAMVDVRCVDHHPVTNGPRFASTQTLGVPPDTKTLLSPRLLAVAVGDGQSIGQLLLIEHYTLEV